MRKTIEVSDFEMQRTRDLMLSDGWKDITDDEVFNMALEIRERMEDCSMSAKDAFFDIIY